MTNEATNFSDQVVIKNSIWTLTKHLASSANKAAGKVDAKVYGPIVEARTLQLLPQPPKAAPKESIWETLGVIAAALVGAVILVGIFIGYCSGAIRGRDIIGF